MKKYLFAIMALSVGFSAQAQLPRLMLQHQSPKQQKHRALLSHLLAKQQSLTSFEKPTTIKQRVIAQVTDGGAGSIDSSKFVYSGNRGSRYNFSNPDFMYLDYYDGLYYFSEGLLGFSADMMQADSIIHFSNGAINFMDVAHYGTNNQMDMVLNNYFNNQNLSGSQKYIRHFDSQGHLYEVYELYLNPNNGSNIYDTVSKQEIHYNSTFTQVMTDTTFDYNGAGDYEADGATIYHYNSNGQITGANYFINNGGLIWSFENKVAMTYYSDGNLQTLKGYDLDNNSNLALSDIDSFGYTSGFDYFTTWTEDSWDEGSFEDGTKMTQYPGTNGLPDSVVALERDSYNGIYYDAGKMYYAYNSYDNPISEEIHFADDPTVGYYRFYYETFDDQNTGMSNIAQDEKLSVYPNPFRETLNINWQTATQAKSELTIYNALGQNVFQKTMTMHHGQNQIDLATLPIGLYLLKIQDEGGFQKMAKIIKK